MSPVSNETKLALLEQRMDNVERRVESVASERPTIQEVEVLIAKSVPSREDIKNDMAEAFTMALASQGEQKREDKQATRQWVIEILKILATVIGTGGLITLYQLVTAGVK